MSKINKKFLKDLKRSCEIPPGLKRDQLIKMMDLFTIAFPDIKAPVVGFGGVLCLEGIRHITSDVDVSIPAEGIKTLEESGIFEFATEVMSDSGEEVVIYRCGVLDVHLNDPKFSTDIKPYRHYDFYVMTLEKILYFKKIWNRPKDQEDIRKIEKVLASK